MDLIRKLYVKAAEFTRGQTMTEYALILAAIAVVAYASLKTVGASVNTLLTSVNTDL